MNAQQNTQNLRSIMNMLLVASMILLFLHFYYWYYWAFDKWHLTATISDRLLYNLVKTGLFKHAYTSKLIAVGVLGLFLLGGEGRKDEKFTCRGAFTWILAGVALYFLSLLLIVSHLPWDICTKATVYMIVSLVGYLMIMMGGSHLSRVIRPPFPKGDILNRDNAGFPQETRLLTNEFSVNLPARYAFRGKTKNSYINFVNPYRGILIIGSPGCGKSRFVVENIIRQYTKKTFSLFVYDFKYPDLTLLTYNQVLRNAGRYPDNTRFFNIQFEDLARSHRCNLILPETMEDIADAHGISKTIFLSINKSWAHQQGQFFSDSAINFFGLVIWFLKKYKNGLYCTLPHAIELAQVEYSQLFTILRVEPEIETPISSFVNAYLNNSNEMLDGQVASAAMSLSKLASPKIYYVLSGNDFTLDINDPEAPKIVCLGNNPQKQEALAPVFSLFIDRLNSTINKKGGRKSAVICDEFATVRATGVLNSMATGRSNNIVTVMAIQDFHQLEDHYSSHEAKKILNMTGNLICGQVGGDTAHGVSERFHKTMQDRRGMSVNSADASFSSSQQLETAISPATIAGLSSGEFVGITADEPDNPIELKAFHARIIIDPEARAGEKEHWCPLPFVRYVDQEIIDQNFLQIKAEVKEIVRSEMERIVADETLRGLIVKK